MIALHNRILELLKKEKRQDKNMEKLLKEEDMINVAEEAMEVVRGR